MGRTVDSHAGIAGPAKAQAIGAIRAGLANGSMVRGLTEREARGGGHPPRWGDILLPGDVDAVTPPLGRGQDAVAWEVIGRGDRRRAGLAGAGGGDTGDVAGPTMTGTA